MKSRMRGLLAVVAALAMALALAGCAPTSNGASTVTVTDGYNRSVDVPENVESVATVGSGARFVVYAGAQDKLVAVTEKETESSPARPYTVVYQDLFSKLPSTSNGNHLMETNVNVEELIEAKPDVIISSRSAEECDDLQEKTGIPVVGVCYQDQLFTDNVYSSIQAVGAACGTADHADEVVSKMKQWQADLADRVSKVDEKNRPSVYVGAVNYKGAKGFTGTYAHYVPLEILGADNVADETGQTGSVDVELEQVGEWDPGYMFLNMGNADLLKQEYAKNKKFFDSLTAFKEGNLYSQPSYNFNGTNIEMGICDTYFIGMTIYPEQFGDIDAAQKYDEIFSTMLGKEYYGTMKEAGMDFKKVSLAG